MRLDVPDGEVIVLGAPELVAQMLDKLVANAVEFSTEGTSIVVRLERAGAEVRLSVENEGPLLPDAMREGLFDSMVSVRGDQMRGDQGGDAPHLGLGLYIVRLIAEAHGGQASAQNRGDGRGVVVTVVASVSRGRRRVSLSARRRRTLQLQELRRRHRLHAELIDQKRIRIGELVDARGQCGAYAVPLRPPRCAAGSGDPTMSRPAVAPPSCAIRTAKRDRRCRPW